MLQEHTQSLNKKLPIYELLTESGPAHKKTFTVQVSYNGIVYGTGIGATKKEAEQNAAAEACKNLNVKDKE